MRKQRAKVLSQAVSSNRDRRGMSSRRAKRACFLVHRCHLKTTVVSLEPKPVDRSAIKR